MLHKLETEPSDVRESSDLESLLSGVGWSMYKVSTSL